MNKERILRVADAIESVAIEGLGFNMRVFVDTAMTGYEDKTGHNCGTVACIAGYAVAVASRKKNGAAIKVVKDADREGWSRAQGSVYARARKYLGLNEEQAESLFYAGSYNGEGLSKITQKRAVAVLRHLADTGVVNWNTRVNKL